MANILTQPVFAEFGLIAPTPHVPNLKIGSNAPKSMQLYSFSARLCTLRPPAGLFRRSITPHRNTKVCKPGQGEVHSLLIDSKCAFY